MECNNLEDLIKFEVITGFTLENFLELYLAGIIKIDSNESNIDLKSLKIAVKHVGIEEIKKQVWGGKNGSLYQLIK